MNIKTGFKEATVITGEGLGATEWIFRRWAKNGKDRIYVSYRGKRDYGYIDLVDGSNHVDANEYAQEAVKIFIAEYTEK